MSRPTQRRGTPRTALEKHASAENSKEHTSLLRKLRQQFRTWFQALTADRVDAGARGHGAMRHADSLKHTQRSITAAQFTLDATEMALPSAKEYQQELRRQAALKQELDEALKRLGALQARDRAMQVRRRGQDRLVGVLREQLKSREAALEMARKQVRAQQRGKDHYRSEWLNTREAYKKRVARNAELREDLTQTKDQLRSNEVAQRAVARALQEQTDRATVLEGARESLRKTHKDVVTEVKLSRDEALRAVDPETKRALQAGWARRDQVREERAQHRSAAPSITPSRELGRSARSGSQEVLLPVFEETKLVRTPAELRDTAKIAISREDSDGGRGL